MHVSRGPAIVSRRLNFLPGRSYTARPIFSTDGPGGSRFKLGRFLHPGRQTVLSVYGPICFGPLPLLAYLRSPDGSLRLAASGAPL